MPKVPYIELGFGAQATRIPILYEDRSVLAVDKPPGWMLVPFTWQKTDRNLMAAITSSIAGGDFWARSRNLKFLRNVHRLDADTTGILLFAKSPGAVDTLGDLFESRQMEKTYLAVVLGVPKRTEWTCQLKLAPDTRAFGRMRVDTLAGKEAETHFRVLAAGERVALVEARPVTGRTHQIRVHLAESSYPVLGDPLYGRKGVLEVAGLKEFPMALRAVSLSYRDPFTRRPVEIAAPAGEFCSVFGFATPSAARPRAER